MNVETAPLASIVETARTRMGATAVLAKMATAAKTVQVELHEFWRYLLINSLRNFFHFLRQSAKTDT